jgi:hypothetical protein
MPSRFLSQQGKKYLANALIAARWARLLPCRPWGLKGSTHCLVRMLVLYWPPTHRRADCEVARLAWLMGHFDWDPFDSFRDLGRGFAPELQGFRGTKRGRGVVLNTHFKVTGGGLCCILPYQVKLDLQ